MEERGRVVEVEAEEGRAAHAGEAVRAAGDVDRLEGDREHHLRERQRQHEKEDPRGAHRDRADREREKCGDERRSAEAEQEIVAPEPLPRDRGRIRAGAEIRGVAERRHPRGADQKVERQREDRDDQHALEDRRRVTG